jgi:hypothetical protein
MSDGRRWVLAFVFGLLVVGLITFARGRTHHHGEAVGEQALGSSSTTAVAGVLR